LKRCHNKKAGKRGRIRGEIGAKAGKTKKSDEFSDKHAWLSWFAKPLLARLRVLTSTQYWRELHE
jgi:hypothetical protein